MSLAIAKMLVNRNINSVFAALVYKFYEVMIDVSLGSAHVSICESIQLLVHVHIAFQIQTSVRIIYMLFMNDGR